jgi:hypothetical protein
VTPSAIPLIAAPYGKMREGGVTFQMNVARSLRRDDNIHEESRFGFPWFLI